MVQGFMFKPNLLQRLRKWVLVFTTLSHRSLVSNSCFFNASWYQVHANLKEGVDPITHFLENGSKFSPSEQFDSKWYLNKYPDVALVGINPLVHFLKYGQAEGRLPMQVYAQLWDCYLWAGLEGIMIPRLRSLLEEPNTLEAEMHYATWALARWYAWKGDWGTTRNLLWQFQSLDDTFYLGLILMAVESAQRCGKNAEAQALLSRWLARKQNHPDLCLAQANLVIESGNIAECLRWINSPLLDAGLLPVRLNYTELGLSIDNLFVNIHESSRASKGPMVSVIVPAYNAESTITTAIRSLFNQSWRALEILVVDDASSDGTWSLLQQLARECPPDITMRLLRNEKNQGAYVSRNHALAEVNGDFITCHDSDDWSHPQKISAQVQVLLDKPNIMASVSHWVRVTPKMYFHRWRVEEGWIDRNVSSLMFRRTVFDELGYWDRVSIAADTEYYYRIFAVYGGSAVTEVLPGLPLSFGRATPESLSQNSVTHEVSQYGGVRKDYMDAAHRWHKRNEKKGGLYLSSHPVHRPFFAPQVMCRESTEPSRLSDPLDQLQQAGLFDSIWYRYRYPDLLEISIDPLQHFLTQGLLDGRDPGPNFSSSGYANFYGLGKSNVLSHYLTEGRYNGYSTCPVFQGKRGCREGVMTVMLCGHQAGDQVYGAERCLLDILQGLDKLGLNVVVTLPNVGNHAYLEQLREYSIAVAVLPYGWWMEARPGCEKTVVNFMELIATYEVNQVYLNTSVLYEPALAAKRVGLPVTVHVHELPIGDPELCQVLNSDSNGITHHVLSLADRLIANSSLVTNYFHEAQSKLNDGEGAGFLTIHTVLNTINMERLLKLAPPPFVTGEKRYLTVGMVSSNLPKKGLDDFIEMAKMLEQQTSLVRCVLFGPHNQYIDSRLTESKANTLPGNLSFEGYVSHPEDALVTLDVLVNLSHCQESFGRTVLEAMAAGRPVVCYRWGALPELVVAGETGYLSPFGEIEHVAKLIVSLAKDTQTMEEMGAAGRKRAVDVFGGHRFNESIERVFSELN